MAGTKSARVDDRAPSRGAGAILCGGESDAALRRAARLCDGWVGYAYAWDDAVRYAQKLKDLRREYGRENEPFDILLALMEPPTPDLYKRAEEAGITQVMGVPWGGMEGMGSGDVERFRGAHRAVRRNHHREGRLGGYVWLRG